MRRALSLAFAATEILLVRYSLEPFDVLAVECLLNGDMRHRCRRRCSMPMLVSGRAPDNVACTDFDAGFAVALSPAASGRNDEGLAKRMGMPVGSRAGFKGNACAGDARRRWGRV